MRRRLLIEQIELGRLTGCSGILLVRARLRFHDIESIQVENGRQRRTHVALGRVPRDSPVHFEPRETLTVEEGNSRTSMVMSGGIENAVHFQAIRMLIDGARPALGDGPAPREQTAVRPDPGEATLAGQVNQRKGHGRIKLREAAHPELSDADGPIPRFLPERLNECAELIARSIQDTIPPQWVVETIPAGVPEVQRGIAV